MRQTPTVRDRILAYLAAHPEGADDDELAAALGLKQRQQAYSRCTELAGEGLIRRDRSTGKWRNYPLGSPPLPPVTPSDPVSPPTLPPQQEDPARPWFWEGNVQARVAAQLQRQGYKILFAADTASKETGRDIEAEDPGGLLWVTVKGYPVGTLKTQPSTQAGHWFKQAVFDLLVWRGESEDVKIAIALPDYPRYRRLAQKIAWLQPVVRFSYFWAHEDGTIAIQESA